MKALSIRQPWAWAICHAGKDIENRDWSTSFRGPIWIHAGKSMTKAEYDNCIDTMRIIGRVRPFVRSLTLPPFSAIQRGGIVGRARIVDCVDRSDSPWFFGRYGLVLADVEPVAFIPCAGKLGFFVPEIPDD